ncbi:MAG: capsule assembly Wzi family protein [Bacteroidetes bacterium]|nr:capsule assembly Wzi family protein [Bacteroidota bacterium]
MILLLLPLKVYAQAELVPVEHPVYTFLKKMQIENVIQDYSSSSLPLSRQKVAQYLETAGKNKTLSATDRDFLEEYTAEFYFDMKKDASKNVTIFGDRKGNILSGRNFRYLYGYSDSSAALWINSVVRTDFYSNNGDSLLNRSAGTADIGFTARGSLLGKVGYSLEMHTGRKISGSESSSDFLKQMSNELKSDREFVSDGTYYANYRGYVRYQAPSGFLGVTAGHDKITIGTGYMSKLFLSESAPAFSFLKLDLNYKAISYSFFYGSLKGDSVNVELKSKNIAGHRLDVRFTDRFRAGFYESIIISNDPFSFSFINPLSFLTSADLNSGAKETTLNNSVMGIDFEFQPVKNVAIQGTLLIDDLNLKTLTDTSYFGNENKFGYQAGIIWSKAFNVSSLVLTAEYTRLDPFVYSHRTNKSSYTNWGISLGSQLPPNSDEIAVGVQWRISPKIQIFSDYRFQRSAYGIIFDENGKLLYNFGGDINYGYGDYYIIGNRFLNGNRVNKSFFSLQAKTELTRQIYVNFLYRYSDYNLLYSNSQIHDNTLVFSAKLVF